MWHPEGGGFAAWDPIEIACLATGKPKLELEIYEIKLVCLWLMAPDAKA